MCVCPLGVGQLLGQAQVVGDSQTGSCGVRTTTPSSEKEAHPGGHWGVLRPATPPDGSSLPPRSFLRKVEIHKKEGLFLELIGTRPEVWGAGRGS